MGRGRRLRTLLIVLGTAPVIGLAAFLTAVALTPLPTPNLPEATEIADASGKPISRLFTENRVELPVVEMPQHLLDAVVAVEDDRFYTHRGVDPIGVLRAAVRNLKAGKVMEGGSTLTQQLAKNLYLSHERTLTRKIKEAVLTVKLEYTYSKKEILGMYWNTIYLGRGTYGAEVAAQRYFGKSARDLTLAESALMAGLPRSPEYYSPLNHPDHATARRNLVLEKMAEQNYITSEAAVKAKTEPLRMARAPELASEAPYFVDYVVRELKERYPDVSANLYQGGYRIETTLDLAAQKAAEAAVAKAAPAAAADGQPQVALVSLDPNTGYIHAMVGGRERKVDRNRTLEPQQPGSAFKPFVYAAALETRKYTSVSTQLDAPAEFPGATPGEPWRPKNYGGKYSNRPTGMREALKRSLNVVTAQWMNTLKPEPVINLAKRMGIESELPENLTIGLGSGEVTPLELTRAYAPLANGGFAVKPIAVLRVTDRNGMVIAEQHTVRQRVLDPGVAFIVTDLLKEVLRPDGTAANAGGYLAGRPAAGKTGTSDESRDAWFVGYTPDLVTGVWVGNDANQPGNWEGGSAAAPIWGFYMSRALQGKPQRDWTPPGGLVAQDICRLTGLLPNASCPTAREWFMPGTVPTEVDPTVHWDHVLPSLPGVPWAPPGTLPPGAATAPEEAPVPNPLLPALPLPFPFPTLPTEPPATP